jgi:dolichol-phosphate mannosyltransferase
VRVPSGTSRNNVTASKSSLNRVVEAPFARAEIRPGPDLTVVVPTFNERANVRQIVERLDTALAGISWEVLFVDDESPDGTTELVREIGRADSRVRGIERIGRRGLSTACIEGMLATNSPVLAVIDGDLQHDESLLPRMYRDLIDEDLDLVVGSRYLAGGDTPGWQATRRKSSRIATRLSRLVLKSDLADPMSGFFVIRREAFDHSVRRLSGLGFKILLDILASSTEPLRFKELPYSFRVRQAGTSKLDGHVAWDYGMLLLDKWIGHLVPVRFVSFAIVGALGVVIHLLVQALLIEKFAVSFFVSQSAATLVAMTSNFTANNLLTYRDQRLRGFQWLRGWFSFCLACSIGAAANVGIAAYIYQNEVQWIIAAVAGIMVSAVWNFAVTKFYTWKLV